ncbi:Primosomal protein N' [wastewater metagenome]|uniref:DNA 3'-5' helicase n=2 Tax=unclassified sequences TaxID=12908 RepID=A0A5B8RBS3_9ZZZZ|nr:MULTISPECIES: primosomal protein N' [Arhodomonas]MCS4505910.1 primosomal protein N' [Arhodomonas aquaeolei]QEA04822.1 primosomal protein N' [uncultured organism]
MPEPPQIARVAVPGPLPEPLDYRITAAVPEPGARVRVPLGRRQVIGVVVATATHSELPTRRLRPLGELLDDTAVLPGELLELTLWAAGYYHHPVGEALTSALPVRLRHGQPAQYTRETVWRLTDTGRDTPPDTLAARAPRQAALLARLQSLGSLAAAHFPEAEGDWRGGLQRLVERGLARAGQVDTPGLIEGHDDGGDRPTLNDAQRDAVDAVRGAEGFAPLVVEGVTGSGKTEVYLHAIEAVLAAGRQALVIVPEIGLTPQLVDRFARRLAARIAVLHSGLAAGERLDGWLAARDGVADVIIGTRSAVFTPLARPGLILVDEEHDASLKQQDGFRYSARDLAVVRAQRLGLTVILGSATPSLETLHNMRLGRYRELRLPQRAGGAAMPRFRLLDVRGRPLRDGLSAPLIEQMRAHLDDDGQVLVFLNRRGFAPVLLCHECGWVSECERCDARLTYHRHDRRLHCHHCDHERPVPRACPDCGSVDLRPVGQGTERLAEAIEAAFPDTAMVRIDRDSTRRKGAFERQMAAAQRGEARILLGTQMLAKGHHLPAVTLVAVVDADQGLFSADFRAPERLAQLIIQVAGRAGRAERPGEVAIQTHHPEHPLLQLLVHAGYRRFAEDALLEREAAGLPPYTAMALLRAEAVDEAAPREFLDAARAAGPEGTRLELLGPVPAPMERRAGRVRAQLLVRAPSRRHLQAGLKRWLPGVAALPQARRVRWSIDVDPADML